MIYRNSPKYKELYKQMRVPIKAFKGLGISITELAPKLKEIREINLGHFNLKNPLEKNITNGFSYLIKASKMWVRLIKNPPEKEVASIVYAFIFFCYLNGKDDF